MGKSLQTYNQLFYFYIQKNRYKRTAMSLYGKLQYWEERYSRNLQPFDWYQRFYAIKQHVINAISVRQQSMILIPGCGNSRLAEQMLEQGYSNIISIDNSVICIKNMTLKYKQKTQRIKFESMDATNLNFGTETFDGIVDKALLDCIMCGQNAHENAFKMLCEMHRVLKKKGAYMILSYEKPSKRLHLLQKSHFAWKVSVRKIPKPTANTYSYSIFQEDQESGNYFLYVCIKQ